MNCVIDCRENESSCDKLLTLNLGGRYVMQRAIDAALEADVSRPVYVLTNSPFIAHLCGKIYSQEVRVTENIDGIGCPRLIILGRAPFIKAESLNGALQLRNGSCNVYSAVRRSDVPSITDFLSEKKTCESCGSVFALVERSDSSDHKKAYISDTEALLLNTRNDFELAVTLTRNENKSESAGKAVLGRIEEKAELFESPTGENTVGLIGHSQLDNWEERNIGGYNVLNYGIRGISSFEYYDFILREERLKLTSDIYLVMHGANDIVYDHTLEEMLKSIMRSFEYIAGKRPSAQIFFICCAHVNGRLDRSNLRIDEFNDYMLSHLPPDIVPIRLDEMDDEFGSLKADYTVDGLHFSEKGYEKLKEIIEKSIKGRPLK